jgi:glycolate oxidase iron-sulfur subunit
MIDAKIALRQKTDTCVKCGLCLPHCPTYTHTENENESPRGRIALIQAWTNHQLPITPKLIKHIDSCLQCRACEKVCPAVVPYGKLIDEFKVQIHHDNPSPLSVKLLKKLATDKKWRQRLHKGLAIYQRDTLHPIVRWAKLPQLIGLSELDRLLPTHKSPTNLANFYPAFGDLKGDVGLFMGCMSELFDSDTLLDAIHVLTHIGFNVHLPNLQTCCGALALHDGEVEDAQSLAIQNTEAFEGDHLQAIITIASGCGSTLQEYNTQSFSKKVIDISHFLAQHTSDKSLALQPLIANVLIHSPCTLKNVMKTEKSVIKLIKQIPELNVSHLPDTSQCCGSAGSYSLRHEKMATTLLNELLDAALTSPIDYLVSSNIGCALHLTAGLKARGQKVKVVHPITLLARQLTV